MTANCILERVTETKSTNDDLLARWRAGQLIDPVARIAHNQTAGKGRAGRAWLATPEDSLCFSLAFPFKRTPAELSGLSLVVGMAVIAGIADVCTLSQKDLHDAGLRLKWPNDLLINHVKLGGILIEGGQAKPGDPTWMVIGIGLNLRKANSIEIDLDQSIGALDQLLESRETSLDAEYVWLKLITSLEQYLHDFDLKGFSSYQEQWQLWDAYQDQAVCISGASKEPIYGIAKGVNASGALLLQQDNNIIAIHAGDVSLRVQS